MYRLVILNYPAMDPVQQWDAPRKVCCRVSKRRYKDSRSQVF